MENKTVEPKNTDSGKTTQETTFRSGQKSFNVQAILDLVFNEMSPADIAADLDYTLELLFLHVSDDDTGANGVYFSTKYSAFKLLRNAFIKGMDPEGLKEFAEEVTK